MCVIHLYHLTVSTSPSHSKKGNSSLPYLLCESPEQQLFREFKESKYITVAEAQDLLNSYQNTDQGDIRYIRGTENDTMLHVASKSMDFRVIKLLYDFDPNETDKCGNTALHLAIQSEKIQNVMYIGRQPICDPNIRNRDDSTPLHSAVSVGSVVILRFLLNLPRLDKNLNNKEGISALDMIHSDPLLSSHLKKNTLSGSLIGGKRPEMSELSSYGSIHAHIHTHTCTHSATWLYYNSSVICSSEHLAIDMTIHSSKNGGKISIFSIDSRGSKLFIWLTLHTSLFVLTVANCNS